MADYVVPEWMETAADREERLERERMAEQRLIQAQRQAHLEALQLCSDLVRAPRRPAPVPVPPPAAPCPA
jgi:hypothetical protein